MRSCLFTLCLLGCAMLATPAAAISEKNETLLKDYFRSQGEVIYELYAPFGGPELGGAILRNSGGAALQVVEVQGRADCKTLYTQPVNPDFTPPPFTFLLTGQHLFVYSTTPWTGPDGLEHQRGDLKIISLLPESAGNVLFELKDVCDLRIEPGGALTLDNLLWQPSSHFLNRFGFLPRKSDYFRLSLDMADGKYKLYQHLAALPDAATNDWANLNNRALYHYSTFRLKDASYLLEQASRVAEGDQSIITRNQQYVKSEITDLAAQQNLLPDLPYSEPLESFWQGDYAAVLRALEVRQQQGLTAFDYAVYGLSLAQLQRWPAVDNATITLEKQNFPYLSDYLWELIQIALYQGFPDVAQTYLVALQVTDPKHPGCATGTARLERLRGNLAEAERVLERYLADPAVNSRDVADARLELCDLYHQRGNLVGCQQLVADALKPPVTNLQAYAELLDYIDYSTARIELPVDQSNRMKAPEDPLESIGYQPGLSIE
jgi:hypothetical protein